MKTKLECTFCFLSNKYLVERRSRTVSFRLRRRPMRINFATKHRQRRSRLSPIDVVFLLAEVRRIDVRDIDRRVLWLWWRFDIEKSTPVRRRIWTRAIRVRPLNRSNIPNYPTKTYLKRIRSDRLNQRYYPNRRWRNKNVRSYKKHPSYPFRTSICDTLVGRWRRIL